MCLIASCQERIETARVKDLRKRVRAAMEWPPVTWECPERIAAEYLHEPLPVRKARAIALKLSRMPTELWEGQLFAGSMTLEHPRVHAEWGFPDYLTAEEAAEAQQRGLSIYSVFGHIVPDYPTLLAEGLRGIRADAGAQRPAAQSAEETAFLDAVCLALDAVIDFAGRLAARCAAEAAACSERVRAGELRQMAENLSQVPACPAQTCWQA